MAKEMKLRLRGLTVQKYVGYGVSGHNCDFEEYSVEKEKYYLHFSNEWGRPVTITLDEQEGECCSGWTTASWGEMKIDSCPKQMPWTHKAKENVEITIPTEYEDEINNEVFSYSDNGGDAYYPMGYVSVNMDLFEEVPRAMKKRPVWIFKGNSGLGKSTIGAFINELSVYETDMNETLPREIVEDVVVLGNKYPFTVEQIKEKLFGEVEVIIVDFTKGE